jgi:hypothetical protein
MSGMRYPFIRSIAVAVLAAGCLAVAACGEDESSGASNGGDSREQKARDAALKFAECMRGEGIDVPDPQISEDGKVTQAMRVPKGVSPEKIQAAQDKCQKHQKGAGGQAPSEEEQAKMREQALAFAQCMREQGIDFPDPQFEEGGKVIMGGKRGSGFDPEDPDFREAQEACRDKLPGGGPGAGGSQP